MLDTRPLKGGRWIRRRRSCASCGLRWKTYEKVAPDPEFSFHHTTGSGVTTPLIDSDHTPNCVVPTQPVAKSAIYSGSDPISSGSDPSGSLSSPIGSQGVDPARVKPIDYPENFEILWEQTGRRGGKYLAFKAWKKLGKPSWTEVQAPWRAYLLSERPRAGFVKDLSSWLNGRGHEQDWQPAKGAAVDARCDWHRKGSRRPSNFPKPGCPDCKHHAARARTRSGEPVDIGAIAAQKSAELEAAAQLAREEAAQRFRQERDGEKAGAS